MNIIKKNIHFFVILISLAMQMFTFGEVYRIFAYLNLLMVAVSLYYVAKGDKSLVQWRWLRGILFFPVCFVVLHFISQQDVVMLKEMRHILLAVSILIGIVLLSKKSQQFLQGNLFIITALLIFIYTAGQLIAVYYYDKPLYGQPYGTTKNPHYLAFYSAVCLLVCIYGFFKGTFLYKSFFGISIIILGYFLLKTGSRPAWLGLFFSALVVIIFFLDKKIRLQALASFITLLTVLLVTNAGGFLDRSKDLIQTVKTEERVTIWQDTWKMQMNSTTKSWFVGHGIDSFDEDFKPYSTYHRQKIDFNSPHNYVLEMLYISGLLGLTLFLIMYWSIYKNLVRRILLNNEHKALYIMLFSILTTCFIFAGITLPFFNSKSMNIIACVIGVMFYLDSVSNQILNSPIKSQK